MRDRRTIVILLGLAALGCGQSIPDPPAYVARVKLRLFYRAAASDHVARSLTFLPRTTNPPDVPLAQAQVVEARLEAGAHLWFRLDDGERIDVSFCRVADEFHFDITSDRRAESPLTSGVSDARGLWFVGNASRLSPARERAHVVIHASERITFLGCPPPD